MPAQGFRALKLQLRESKHYGPWDLTLGLTVPDFYRWDLQLRIHSSSTHIFRTQRPRNTALELSAPGFTALGLTDPGFTVLGLTVPGFTAPGLTVPGFHRWDLQLRGGSVKKLSLARLAKLSRLRYCIAD